MNPRSTYVTTGTGTHTSSDRREQFAAAAIVAPGLPTCRRALLFGENVVVASLAAHQRENRRGAVMHIV